MPIYLLSDSFGIYAHGAVFLACTPYLVGNPRTGYMVQLKVLDVVFLFCILLVQLCGYPCRADTELNQVCGNIYWDNLTQLLDVSV